MLKARAALRAPPAGEPRAGSAPRGRCAAAPRRGARARSSRRWLPGRRSGTCSCTRPRSPPRCRAARAARCRSSAPGRSRRRSRARARRARCAPDRTPGRCGTAPPATAPARSAAPCAARHASMSASAHASSPARGASSMSAPAGSRPCQAICEATAWRSEEKAPASIRMRRRSPCGPVEARQHQVQVHGERVHRHHFVRLRAGEGGEPRRRGSRDTASTGGAHARDPRRRAAPSHRAPARRAARAASGCRPSECPHR